MGKVFQGLITIVAAVSAAPSMASEVETVWMVKAIPSPTKVQTVASGNDVLRQTLLPEGLVVLSSDAISAKNGKTILPAGSRLIKARADVPVYCDLDAHKAKAVESMLIGSIGERTACLIDGNADGIFDSHFGNKVQFEGFPIVRGKYPKKPGALQSLPYKETDPAVLSGSYTIAIQYRGDANLSGKHMFRTTFSGPKDKSALSQWTAIPGKGLPREASIMGSRFTILEELGPQVRLRVDRTMPEQPFQVIRTFSYR